MFQSTDTVTRILRLHPATARVFERHGMDYCCGGNTSLEAACAGRGLETAALIRELEDIVAPAGSGPDLASLSLSELAAHIEATHHAYLREELPRLDAMTERVALVHGHRNSRLEVIRDIWHGVSAVMSAHLDKEEQILFPMVRALEDAAETPSFHCGSIANPVAQMEREHDEIEEGIGRLRELTDGYAAPPWACGTYRAMIEGLARFEADTMLHTFKEENGLFPRAVERERALAGIHA